MSYEAVAWAMKQPVGHSEEWTDRDGRVWPVPCAKEPLRFTTRSHAAIRAFVYWRDGYSCAECGESVPTVPEGYDGTKALFIASVSANGKPVPLVIDHMVSRKNGGSSHPTNLQALCALCNNIKAIAFDKKRRWSR